MIVEIEELLAEMGGFQPTDEQRQHAETVILPGVQGALEEYLGRPVEPTHTREMTVYPDDNGFLIVRNSPIQQLLKVWDRAGAELPTPPAPTTPIPPMEQLPGFPRQEDYSKTGCSTFGIYVGRMQSSFPHDMSSWNGYPPYAIIGGPINTFLGGGVPSPSYTIEYIGGLRGFEIPGMKTAILTVAVRETERQFDDTLSIKGGTQDAAADSDDRAKGWTEDELSQWDRYRRRNIV